MSKTKTIFDPAVVESVKSKVSRTKVSGKFVAILDVMFDIQPRRTHPALVELIATTDDCLFAMREQHCGANVFLGSMVDLRRNCEGLADTWDMSQDERDYFFSLIPKAR